MIEILFKEANAVVQEALRGEPLVSNQVVRQGVVLRSGHIPVRKLLQRLRLPVL